MANGTIQANNGRERHLALLLLPRWWQFRRRQAQTQTDTTHHTHPNRRTTNRLKSNLTEYRVCLSLLLFLLLCVCFHLTRQTIAARRSQLLKVSAGRLLWAIESRQKPTTELVFLFLSFYCRHYHHNQLAWLSSSSVSPWCISLLLTGCANERSNWIRFLIWAVCWFSGTGWAKRNTLWAWALAW